MREIRQFGTYRLDIEGRRLERAAGEAITLGAKAFDVLAYLVEHAGEPVSRKVLMDAVWPDTVVEENNLTQAISALRRALGDGYIATLPGRGYQFVAEVSREPNGGVADPQGHAVHEPVAAIAAAWRRRWTGRAVAAGAVAMLLVAAGWAWMTRVAENPPPRVEFPIRSIAVLPMRLVSDDPESHEYFADGLSIELRDRLDRLEGVLVSADRSSRAFKDKDADPRTIGEALQVQAVLEGTFRVSADRLRINVSLVEVADGHTLWMSPTYEGELNDAFAIQDRIAHAVVGELSAALGIESPGWAYGGTQNPVAFNHYVTGLGRRAPGIPPALNAAAAEFRKAVEADPHYGDAWAALGIALGGLAIMFPDRAEELSREREHVARRLLEVAPDLPLGRAVSAWIAYDRRDWETSLSGCERIFAATDYRAHQLCAGALTGLGFVSQTLRYRQEAAAADNLSAEVSLTLSRHYALLGRSDETQAEYTRGLEFSDLSWGREEPLLYALMHEGISPEQLARRLEPICAEAPNAAFCRVLRQALINPEEAAKELRGLLERMRSTTRTPSDEPPRTDEIPQNSYIVMLFAAYLGETEIALDALETVAREAPASLYQHFWYPVLSEVRRTPRFKEAMREIGFADWWRQSNRWNDYCRPVGDDDFECV